jgi:hypothetical protein
VKRHQTEEWRSQPTPSLGCTIVPRNNCNFNIVRSSFPRLTSLPSPNYRYGRNDVVCSGTYLPRIEDISCTIGLVVKSNVAIVGPWVRFPDGALTFEFWVRHGHETPSLNFLYNNFAHYEKAKNKTAGNTSLFNKVPSSSLQPPTHQNGSHTSYEYKSRKLLLLPDHQHNMSIIPDATGNTDEAEASIPTENEGNGGRMSVRRKFANMLQYFNPFSTMPPPPQDEDVPATKRPRLEASAGISAAEDAAVDADAVHTTDTVITASSDDAVNVAPTDTVTVAASLLSAGVSRGRVPRRNWAPEEDAKLTGAVKTLGNNWVAVALLVPGRTNAQCCKRWRNHLDTPIGQTMGKWTSEEDAMLIEAVTELGKKWVAVAAMVPSRTTKQCRCRWVEGLDPDINTRRWTAGDDAKLTDAVKELGKDWVAVAAMVPSRTNTQCRKRWLECFDPDINSGRWTADDDAKLTDAVKELGKDWVAAAAMVPGRTNTQCRKRRLECLDPDINSGRWKVEEDAKLTAVVKERGKDWNAAAVMVPGRTNTVPSKMVKSLHPNRSTNAAEQEHNASDDEGRDSR